MVYKMKGDIDNNNEDCRKFHLYSRIAIINR